MYDQKITWGIFNIKPNELHFRGRNFSIANVDCMKTPFTLRIALKRDRNITYVDAEIAGRRTIVTTRIGLNPGTIQIECSEDIDFQNLKMKSFKE